MGAASAAAAFGGARQAHTSGATDVPRALRGLVTGVVGLGTTPVASDAPPASSGYQGPDPGATPAGCAAGAGQGGFTPNEYLDAYQFTPLQQRGLLGQGERVALVEIDGFVRSDLQSFASCFGLRMPPIRQIPVGVAGPLAAGGEATLDLEVLEAAAPELKQIDVYETAANAADVLTALTQPLQNPGFKPQVISVSLGLCEGNTLETVGQAGVRAIETELKVASAAGVSVLGASGDMGSADCSQAGAPPVSTLAVNFPSSSPWVTSVGGTNIDLNTQNQIVNQAVWNDAGTVPGNAGGGGVSELFARPSWQNGLIASPWRAQPDVAMLADVSPGYTVYCTAQIDCGGRGWLAFGGTSAATPLLAGGFALIDEQLRRQGRAALGLANPLLYRLGRNPTSAAQVFYDVTSGTNDVGPFIQQSQQPLGCCTARSGYDEASGWGGVNLEALSQAALVAQHPLATATVSVPPVQQPVRAAALYVNVGCSAACDVAASARLSARGMRTFTVYSFAHLVRRNQRRLKVLFSAAQDSRLKAALRRARPIVASVAAAIVDSAGNIERRTAALRVNVSG